MFETGLELGGVAALAVRGAAAAPVAFPLVGIDAAGWSAQSAAAAPVVPDPDGGAPATMAVTRQGFDATGAATSHAEVRTVTRRVRQPWPNHGALTAGTVALDDYVYATDVVAGVANDSAETSPRPICVWAAPDRRVVGDSIGGSAVPVELVCAHRDARDGRQVACVIFRIGDGTSVISVTVAAAAVSSRATDRHPVVVFALPVTDISSLNAGTITVDAEVYPWIGGAASVARSAADGLSRLKFAPRYYLKDPALAAAPPYVYLSATGNDATGIVSTDPAAAKAAPCLTFAGAVAKLAAALPRLDGAIIRVGAGSFALTGGTVRYQTLATTFIERDPDVARASAVVTFGTAAVALPFGANRAAEVAQGSVTFRDINVTRTGVQPLNAIELAWEGVTFDNASYAATYIGTTAHDWWFGGEILNPAGNGCVGPQTAQEHRLWRGVTVNLGSLHMDGGCPMLGCDISSTTGQFNVGGGRTRSGIIAAFNRFTITGTGGAVGFVLLNGDVDGFGLIQNVFEWVTASAGHPFAVSHDSGTAGTSHIVLHHNSFAGAFTSGRGNLFYDEGATPRSNRLMSMRGNIHAQINIKGDVFRGVNQGNPEGFGAGAPSTRTGNWAYLHGVGCQGEFSQFVSADGAGDWKQDYPGLGARIGTSASVRQDPLFADYKAASPGAAGTGGGSYAIAIGSPAAGIVTRRVLSHDFAGVARPASGNDSAGAYVPA